MNSSENKESFEAKWELLIKSETAAEEKVNAEIFKDLAVSENRLYMLLVQDADTLEQILVAELAKIGDKKVIVKMSLNDKNFANWQPISNENIFILMRE